MPNAHVNFVMSEKLLKDIDKIVESGYFMNRSNAMRYMIRHYINEHLPVGFTE